MAGTFSITLHELPATLRVPDLADYVRALGLAPTPVLSRSFQGTPMHYHGINVGNFFLAEKSGGGRFTEDDEEVLNLFASQASAAIANARTHRDERRVRILLDLMLPRIDGIELMRQIPELWDVPVIVGYRMPKPDDR